MMKGSIKYLLACAALFGAPIVTEAFVTPTTISSPFFARQGRITSRKPNQPPSLRVHATSFISLENDKESMDIAYGRARTVLATLAIILVIIPDKTNARKIATKWGGAAGFGMAAAVSNILRKANDKDRLSSNTYKRINFGLLGFSFLGLAGCPGEAGFFANAAPAMVLSLVMVLARLFTGLVAYRGWTAGIADSVTPLQELIDGAKSNLKGLRVAKKDKKKSLAYRNSLLLVFFGILLNLMGGWFDIRVSPKCF